MKKIHILFLGASFFWASLGSMAVPCSDLSLDLLSGNFVFINQPTSPLLALKNARISRLLAQQAIPPIDDGAPVAPHAIFQVSDLVFQSQTDEGTQNAIGKLDRAALISWSHVPDSCFLLWFSSDLKKASIQQILGQNAQGDLELGTDNRQYGGMQLMLLRH